MNISLLSKWWWKLEKEGGLWQDIIRYKYLRNDTIHSVAHKLNDSSVWYDMLKVKEIYLLGRTVWIRSGNITRFWKDAWLYQQPICEIAPVLFELCDQKDITVDKMRSGEVAMTFRRGLPKDLRNSWEHIWRDASSFPLNERV